jgi:hypothetical protein
MTTTTSHSNSLSSLTGLFVSVPLALLATYGTVTPAQAGLVNILYRVSKAQQEKANNPPSLTLRTAGNSFEFSNITLERHKHSLARSGYMFRVYANVTNTGKAEHTRMGEVVSSVSCMFGKIKDDKDREFDPSCSIPALLPSETSKKVQIAWSSAMADSKSAKFCIDMFNCTRLMTPIIKNN